VTIIEIRPHGNGWKVFEAPGVEPVSPKKEQAIGYAETQNDYLYQAMPYTKIR
jgi:hypothetical protein